MSRIKVISPFEDHPLIEYDASDNLICMEGICMPENAIDMFSPVFDMVSDLLSKKTKIDLVMYFKYLNSMSSKQILRLLLLIKASGVPYSITWNYNTGDDLMRFKGNEFKSILDEDANFQVIELA